MYCRHLARQAGSWPAPNIRSMSLHDKGGNELLGFGCDWKIFSVPDTISVFGSFCK